MAQTFEIGRVSQISGRYNTMVLPIGKDEFVTRFNKWKRGMYIQEAFNNLNASQREFIMTGITQEEWDEMCGDEDD